MTDAVQAVRHDCTPDQIKALFDLPFNDLLFQALTAHRANFDANAVQISTLQTLPACDPDDYTDSAGKVSGCSLHAG